jgi:hypothetical protein
MAAMDISADPPSQGKTLERDRGTKRPDLGEADAMRDRQSGRSYGTKPSTDMSADENSCDYGVPLVDHDPAGAVRR